MSNREKCKKALCDYINALDDDGLYEFILEQGLEGPEMFSCKECEKNYGNSKCDEAGICKTRFLSWTSIYGEGPLAMSDCTEEAWEHLKKEELKDIIIANNGNYCTEE